MAKHAFHGLLALLTYASLVWSIALAAWLLISGDFDIDDCEASTFCHVNAARCPILDTPPPRFGLPRPHTRP